MIDSPPVTQYLFESSVCLTAFYLLYYTLLRKDTFFQFNRFYLLISAGLSLLIPVLQINIVPNFDDQPLAMSKILPMLENYNVQYASVLNAVEEPILWTMSVGDFVSLLYKLGVFLFGIKLLSGLFKMYDLIKASKATHRPEYTMLRPKDENYLASSFFSYIFWNDTKDSKSKIIIDHELVHVKQWHSIDVVLMELMVVVKWFNPLIYLFRNSLRKTHEFIADKYVSEQLGNKYTYAQFIVNENQDDKPNLSNAMFSFVKERLVMLNVKQSSKWGIVKYTMIIPVFASLLMLFSFNMSGYLPDNITVPIKSFENKILNLSEKNLITVNNQNDENWNKQFLWGDQIRISLDEKVMRQDIIVNVQKRDIENFLDQLPSITNHEGELSFYPMYHKSKNETKSFAPNDLLSPDTRGTLLEKIESGDEINFISEFIYNNKIYKQDVTIRVNSFTFSQRVSQNKRNFKWGDIEINYNEEIADNVITRFNMNDAVFLNSEGNISLADYSRFFPQTTSFWPVFDISKNDYAKHLNKKVMIVTEDDESHPIRADQEVEIRIMRKFLKRLKSLDLESINEYKKSLNLPSEIEFHPQAESNGNHEIVQYLKTSVSKLRNSKQIRDWLLLISNGDAVEFNFLMEGDNNDFGLLFLIEDPNKIEYPEKIETPTIADEFATFQIVINRGGKSFVRLDSTLEQNKSIIDAYKTSESYDIIHVPGFKTKMRVVDKNMETTDVKQMAEMSQESHNINPLNLLEFYPESEMDLRLNWGAMISMKLVGNFSFKEFERSYNREFELHYKDESLKILKYEILIPTGSGLYQRIQTDSNNYYKILELLSKVVPLSTIYVDNIILEKDSEKWLLPHQFSYSFE
jgi:hypothetical protein